MKTYPKTNPNDAAFASSLRERGLTKLEYMSTQIMQGLAARSIHADPELVESAVKLAKALIDELNKEESEDEK